MTGLRRPATGVDRQPILLTSYLRLRRDPQRGRRISADSFAYMSDWYESVRSLGLSAAIFHDSLSPAFVRRHATPEIRFHRVRPSPWTPNDQRFFEYRRYLSRRPHPAVFLTDISDVTVVRDPFAALKRHPGPLWVGDEVYPAPIGGLIRDHPWFRRKICQASTRRNPEIAEFFAERSFELPTLNAGVIGGRRREVLDFLDRYARVRTAIGKPRLNLNMPVVNYVLHAFFPGRFRLGAPATSVFKAYQHDRRDVWFRHK